MRSIIPSVAALLFLGQLLSSPIFVRATAANLSGPCINISAKAEAHTSPALPRYSNLFAAAAENHVESVCLLLQKGADINARNKQNLTPLQAAILPSENQHKMVQLLLQHGADVNAKNAENTTALHAAVNMNHLDIVRVLLQFGADANAVAKNGTTALLMAVLMNSFNVAHLLLQHGANVNANGQCEAHIPDFRQCVTTITFDTLCLNRNNLTPLHVSVSKNDKKMVPLLLEHGADVNATNKWGGTALHAAALENRIALADLLLQHLSDVNAMTDSGFTPMDFAVGKTMEEPHNAMSSEMVELLQKHGGRVTLHGCAHYNYVEGARAILQEGADLNRVSRNGDTALYSAVLKNNVEMATFLLDHGADINARNKRNATALHAATIKNSIEIARFLLQRGANVSATSENNLTALHFAAHQNFTELGMLLLQNSADPSAKDIKCALAYSAITLLRHQLPFLPLGKTPADFASEKGHQELIELMRYSGIHAVLKRAKSESDEM